MSKRVHVVAAGAIVCLAALVLSPLAPVQGDPPASPTEPAFRHGLELRGLRFEVAKEMSTEGPRRIARLTTHLWMPFAKASAPASLLEKVAHACPVHKSLDPSVDKPIVFHWAE